MSITFDAKKIAIIFGAVALQDFADGEFITISDEEDIFNASSGADGNTTYNVNNNTSCEVTVTCQQRGQADSLLSQILFGAEAATGSRFVKLPMTVIDTSGTNAVPLVTSAEAAIRRYADVSRSKSGPDHVEWMFRLDKATRINGSLLDLPENIANGVNEAISRLL